MNNGVKSDPKITDIRLVRIFGSSDVRKVYGDAIFYQSVNDDSFSIVNESSEKIGIEQIISEFVEVTSDTGHQGIYGPIYPSIPPDFIQRLRETLLGLPVFAHEDCWNKAFQSERHGRSGHMITAIGAVDCALWDLHGKILDQPVYQLIGGTTRTQIPCYASLLGFSSGSPAMERIAKSIQTEGFYAQKWALRCGPDQGEGGFLKNCDVVSRLREALGYQCRLIFDALGKWTTEYTIRFLEVNQKNNIILEEPLGMEHFAGYQQIRKQSQVKLAIGEHLYTRFEFDRYLNELPIRFLQPDIVWCGGLTEALKIITLSSVRGVPVLPHGGGFLPALHLALATSTEILPAVEFHLTLESKRQFFWDRKIKPVQGCVRAPDQSGLGISLDWEKVDKQLTVV